MKKNLKYALLITVLLFILSFCGCSLSENDFYYPDADTGVWAEDVSYDKENFLYDRLDINGTVYVLLQIDNFKFHAADTAVVKEPVANFGNSERYTLYRVGNELNCDLLADNRNRILFCPESEEQVFIEHYSDYNNCRFKICIDYDEKNIYEVSLKKDFFNELLKKYDLPYDTEKEYTVLAKSDIKEIRITPINNDGLIEYCDYFLLYADGCVYWDRGELDGNLNYREAEELTNEEQKYFISVFMR